MSAKIIDIIKVIDFHITIFCNSFLNKYRKKEDDILLIGIVYISYSIFCYWAVSIVYVSKIFGKDRLKLRR